MLFASIRAAICTVSGKKIRDADRSFPEMHLKPHAFVAMPFGVKKDSQGTEIDFNRVYSELIKPALEEAGLDVFRADEEERAGDIRTDMFQELLIADLVVADLTLDNPNVWYELGVRHALRARGVVLICGGRVTTAFDLYTDRKLRYSIMNGVPDPATMEQDKQNLTDMVKATMESWHGRKISPVYHLMPNLQEPDWKSLRIGDVQEFWQQHDAWERRIELARKTGTSVMFWCSRMRRRSPPFEPRPGSRPARPCERPNTSILRWNNSNGGSRLSRRISKV